MGDDCNGGGIPFVPWVATAHHHPRRRTNLLKYSHLQIGFKTMQLQKVFFSRESIFRSVSSEEWGNSHPEEKVS